MEFMHSYIHLMITCALKHTPQMYICKIPMCITTFSNFFVVVVIVVVITPPLPRDGGTA